MVLDGVASKLHESILEGGALEAELIKRHTGGVGQLTYEIRGLVGNHQTGAAFLVGGLGKGDSLGAQSRAKGIKMVGAHQHGGLRVVLHKVIGGLVRYQTALTNDHEMVGGLGHLRKQVGRNQNGAALLG